MACGWRICLNLKRRVRRKFATARAAALMGLFGLSGLFSLGLTAASAQSLPAPLLDINFDLLAQGLLPGGVVVKTQFPSPDVVPGVHGSAWRTDGFSSYLEAPLALDARSGFTLSLWLALESYPSDREVPTHELSPSSIAQQSAGVDGFNVFIDTYGRWGFRVATSAGVVELPARGAFPLHRWAHLVTSVDTASGAVHLFLDGALIGTAQGQPGMSLRLAPVPLRLATPPVLAKILDFTINRLNGAFDAVAVYPQALNAAQRTLLPGPSGGPVPAAGPALRVPESRFAADHLRPRVHAMPPANWANEPHGLLRVGDEKGDAWHLFYQRTPNGPFKTQMHWGHMTSRDLVAWEQLPDALRPELQNNTFGFDMKGIWSGHVIADGGKTFAFYTSVNHGDRLAASNPGIAMAVSEDADLRTWRKLGPILNTRDVKDFRDPYLWKEADSWHMLIGAALETGGGLEYLVLKPGAPGAQWQRQRRFVETAYRVLDIGSEIWEMPVFERLSAGPLDEPTQRVWVLVVNPIGGKTSKYGDPATRAVYWTGVWAGGLFRPYSRTPKNLDLVPGHLAPTVGRAADGSLRAIGIIDERRTPAAQQRAGWAHTFSLPRVWKLMPDQRTLGQAPAPELLALRAAPHLTRNKLALGNEVVKLGSTPQAFELLLELDTTQPSASPIVIDVLASADGTEFTRLTFDAAKGRVTVDKSASGLAADAEGPQVLHGDYASADFGALRSLRVFVDGSAIDVFVNDAAAYGVRSYPRWASSNQVRLMAPGPLTQNLTANVQMWPLRQPPGLHSRVN